MESVEDVLGRLGGVATRASIMRCGVSNHVVVQHNASRLRMSQSLDVPAKAEVGSDAGEQPRKGQAEICLHWRRPAGSPPVAVAPLVAALLHAIDCQTEEAAAVMIDSALNKRRVSIAQLRSAARQLPARYSRVLELCDATSQAGTETLVRLRLRRLGIAMRTQVQIGRIGRVDLLVGNRLVIECDSHQFHDGEDAVRRDFDRDLALIDKDYLVLRLNYRQVVHEWEQVEPVILGLVARRRHLRPAPRD